EITRLLVTAGADVNQRLRNGETPLMMAARTGDVATMEALLDAGAEIDAREKVRGTTALMWAAANANPPAVELLLSRGADPSLRSSTNDDVDSPYLAPKATERIENFYRGAGIRGDSLSEEEASGGVEGLEIDLTREELIARLPEELVRRFEREAAANPEDGEQQSESQRPQGGGLTALHFAVREGDLASVERLLEGGAGVNQVSAYGWTP
ncbi:MAG: ankyrin repeat domain-containing protein, partial [Gammaproteobacteria bacterium]|nr:ankyrin repeat domain-containing protein [Gammaproteobacteria bacterium]